MIATYTKLRNGSWGIRIDSRTSGGLHYDVRPGSIVTVNKRDGSAVTVTVDQIVWQDKAGTYLCTFRAQVAWSAAPGPNYMRTYRRDEAMASDYDRDL